MNFYSLSGFLIAVTSGLMTLLMLFIGKKKLHYLWAVFCFAVFLFGLGIYFVGGSTSPETASFWWKIAHIGAILIPVFFLHFVYEFLEKKKTEILIFLYAVSVLLLITNFTDGLFIDNMRFVFGQFYYDSPPGPFYPLFTIMFFGLTGYSHFLLWLGFKESKDRLIKEKIKFFFFGMAVSFAGGAFNFLPVYGFDIYPYMNLTVFLYPLIISYAIFKHQLFDIKVILVELAVLLLNLFLFINVFTSYLKTDFMLNVLMALLIFIFSVVLLRGIYKDISNRERIFGLLKEMEVANEKLRVLEEQKTEFMSIASHQLRAPLTVIKGYASMILEGTFGHINDSARDAMGKLYKSSQKIIALVEDLLTISRIEQGRTMLNFEMTNFKNLVESTITELKDEVAEAKVDVSFTATGDKEFLAYIDEKKVKQIVKHILENAIKYTTASGSVRVTVADDSLTKKVRLTVSDTGIGMKQEQITSIFERFNLKVKEGGHSALNEKHMPQEGGQNKREEEESTMMEKRTPGIGLYIAQQIIDAHHGTLRIESAGLGKGTIVTVEMPKMREPESQ
ncbi:MAG: ATP-binding protein [Minisyncoccia bacterium]